MQNIVLIILLSLFWGCPNKNLSRPDVPFSKTDTYESVRTTGSRAYVAQHTGWRDAVTREHEMRRLRREAGITGCDGIPATDARITGIASDVVVAERLSRESGGGAGCRCIPMGELCRSGTCYCNEICPNHHGILRGRVNQMNPTERNSLAFINSPSYNNSAYSRYHVSGGFCSGNNVVLRKFQMLSDMRPDLRSWPAMTKGSPEWREYILGQIGRLGTRETPEFLGVASMLELGADTEFRQALRTRGLYSLGENDSAASSPDFWRKMAAIGPVPKFSQPTATTIAAKSSIDPDTGNPVPVEGTPAYHSYVEEKVRRIAQGFPASLPGYSSIKALSSDPTYMEIMGSQSAIDWQTFNSFEDTTGHHGLSSGTSDTKEPNYPNDPMSPDQLSTFIRQAHAYLPRYPDTYPHGAHPGEAWNEDGPFQTLPVSIRSNYPSGDKTKHSYHSIEAWAFKNLPNGGLRVCMKDPNNKAGNDDNCSNYLDIEDPNGPNRSVSYSSFPGETIGKFNFTAYGTGHVGAMTDRLVAYCRRVKASIFRGGACSN